MRKLLLLLLLIAFPSFAQACDKAAAARVQSMLNQMADISMSGERLKYVWHSADWNHANRGTRLSLLRTAADADACMTGISRNIRFYANGKLVGVASPDHGIRLVE